MHKPLCTLPRAYYNPAMQSLEVLGVEERDYPEYFHNARAQLRKTLEGDKVTYCGQNPNFQFLFGVAREFVLHTQII